MHGKRLVVWGLLLAVFALGVGCVIAYAAGPPADAKYVGSAKCRACHFKDYNTWRKTKHAKVFDQLEGAERKNADCLKCHTTGYGKPGGFVSEDKTDGLKNVGCESCHGPGSAHLDAALKAPDEGAWDMKTYKVPQNTCVNCHNPHVNQKDRVAKLRAK